METETPYQLKLKKMSNNELDAEFLRINRLRNETDEDYLTEFGSLSQESWRREYELLPERNEDRINLNANDFNGLWNWISYDFVNKNLCVNPRLSDAVYLYADVPRSVYKKLKMSDFDDKEIEAIQGKYKCEVL